MLSTILHYNTRFIRSISTQDTILILGNGNIAHRIATKGVEFGKNVIVTIRNLPNNLKNSDIKYIQTEQSCMKDPMYWKFIAKMSLQDCLQLTVINTIGGSISDQNTSIDDLNCNIPLPACQGISAAIREIKITSFKIIQLSTAAAVNMATSYGKTKREAELALMSLLTEDLTILRMGYVVEPMIKNYRTQTYKALHRLSIEEIAILQISFLIGKENYNRVEVCIVSINDLVNGIYKIIEEKEYKSSGIIDVCNGQVFHLRRVI